MGISFTKALGAQIYINRLAVIDDEGAGEGTFPIYYLRMFFIHRFNDRNAKKLCFVTDSRS